MKPFLAARYATTRQSVITTLYLYQRDSCISSAMSLRAPNLLKQSPKKLSSSTSGSTLVTIEEVTPSRRPPATRKYNVPRVDTHLVLPGDVRFTQVHAASVGRPTPPSQVNNSDGDSITTPEDSRNETEEFPVFTHAIEGSSTPSRNHAKKRRQWEKWMYDRLPSLVEPYLSILRRTHNLRNSISSPPPPECTCHLVTSRKLKVICVYFDRESNHVPLF